VKLTRKEFLKSAAALGATLAAGLGFLRPRAESAAGLRPPGALSEDEFLARCIRCGRCADACPNRCITAFSEPAGRAFSLAPGRAQEGTPVIFPRQQACNLCLSHRGDVLACTAACPTGALSRVEKTPEGIQSGVTMGTAVVDENLCYSFTGSSCGVCVRACPFEGRALRAGQFETPLLDPAWCVGCGLCERSCIRYPQAITVRASTERAA
jgi:MauM/NapG family ferredoxin protein